MPHRALPERVPVPPPEIKAPFWACFIFVVQDENPTKNKIVLVIFS